MSDYVVRQQLVFNSGRFEEPEPREFSSYEGAIEELEIMIDEVKYEGFRFLKAYETWIETAEPWGIRQMRRWTYGPTICDDRR